MSAIHRKPNIETRHFVQNRKSKGLMAIMSAIPYLNILTGETSALVSRGLVQSRVVQLGDPCDAHGENTKELLTKQKTTNPHDARPVADHSKLSWLGPA